MEQPMEATPTPRGAPGPADTTWDVDGLAVAADVRGDGDGPPVLCLHGFAGGRDDFASVLDGLGRGRQAIAVDLPGHGASEGGADPDAHRPQAVAAWITQLLDEVGAPRAHLVAHSLAGLAVQQLAWWEPTRIASMVLVGSGPGALRIELADQFAAIARAADEEGPEAAIEVSRRGDDPGPKADVEAWRLNRIPPGALLGGARALATTPPVGAALRGLDAPALVVSGADDDIWTPADQRLLAASITGARHVVLPDCGHCPHEERPEAFVRVVRSFLEGADSGGTHPGRRRASTRPHGSTAR